MRIQLEYNLQVDKKVNMDVINLMGLASRDNEKACRDLKNGEREEAKRE